MKRLPIFCIIVVVFFSGLAQEFNPQIDSLINQVSLDSLVKHVRILSGEDSVRIGDSTYLITNRLSDTHIHETKEHRIAAKYLVKILKQYCLQVIEQTFLFREDTIRNIIAIQEGKTYPDKKIIISGHYDSFAWTYMDTALAPGADDNASGVAVVLEAARLISQIETAYTIYYILWDWEENGCQGSENFVFEDTSRTDLMAMINLDMIAYDTLDSGIVDVFCEGLENPLIEIVTNVNSVYGINLILKFWYFNGPSDTMPFGIVDDFCLTVLLLERFWKYDYRTSYYHTINDKIEHFNLNYFHKIAKLGIATTAELALNGLPTAIENESVTMFNQFQLFQNYPNPFNASTNISYFLPFNDYVVLRIFDLNGKLVQTISLGHQTSGIHHLLFDGSHLSSGMYFYQIQGTDHSIVKKMILLK